MKRIILLTLIIATIMFAAIKLTYGKEIKIETPFLLGDVVRVSETQTGTIEAVCTSKEEVFYIIQNTETHTFSIMNLDDLATLQKNTEL